MHSQVPNFGLGVAELAVILVVGSVLVSFAIFAIVSSAKRFGALATFGWGAGLFFFGVLGLSLLIVLLRPEKVRVHEQASGTSVRPEVARSHASRGLLSSSSDALGVRVNAMQRHDQAVTNAPARRRIRPEEPASTAWDENIAPVANIYPSIPDCGRPLAAKLATQLQEEAQSEDDSPKAEKDAPAKYRIALINKNDKVEHADFLNFVIKFREQFTSSFPNSLVEDMTGETDSTLVETSDAAFQQRQVTVYELGSKTRNDVRSGQLVCQLKRRDRRGKVELVSDFVEKLWVADPAKFLSRNANQNPIIGFSAKFATSREEARTAALKDAEIQLAKSTGKTFHPKVDVQEYAVDQFVQKLTLSYGNVWRAAVLIDSDSSDPTLIRYAEKPYAVKAAKERGSAILSMAPNANMPPAAVWPRSRANSESLIAGLMMLTIVVGWISNWMTQGYYRGPVRTVTGSVFVCLGVIFVIFILTMTFA